jgi:hypothetical protein
VAQPSLKSSQAAVEWNRPGGWRGWSSPWHWISTFLGISDCGVEDMHGAAAGGGCVGSRHLNGLDCLDGTLWVFLY